MISLRVRPNSGVVLTSKRLAHKAIVANNVKGGTKYSKTAVEHSPKTIKVAVEQQTHEQKKNSVAYQSMIHEALVPSREPITDPKLTWLHDNIPEVFHGRDVLVRPVYRNPGQSGWVGYSRWEVTWPSRGHWSHQFTGNSTSSDALSSFRMTFDSKEDALTYCKKTGWNIIADEDEPVISTSRSRFIYSENFLPKNVRASMKLMGPKFAQEHFNNPKYGHSNWFMPLKYDGSAPVQQHGPNR